MKQFYAVVLGKTATSVDYSVYTHDPDGLQLLWFPPFASPSMRKGSAQPKFFFRVTCLQGDPWHGATALQMELEHALDDEVRVKLLDGYPAAYIKAM